MFPNEKIVHEIPIYSMPENEFRRRWNKWKQNWYVRSEQMGYTAEQTEEVVSMIMRGQYPRNVWKYNQIVGFIEIAIAPRDVIFHVQKTLDSRIHALGKTKHYIQDMETIGMHFQIKNMSNRELVAEMDKQLQSIQSGLPRWFCLYLDTFNVVKFHIDYRAIQRELEL